jgi:uncharacterized protein YndB with AHSA1/START domain
MSATDSTTLRLERTYDATPEEVFDAWTNPEVLRRWWMVDEAGRTPEADVDLRVGGSYRLAMEDPGPAGARHTVRGVYREVARPERLVYTWAWEEDDGSTGHESTVTVSFVEEGDRTTVVVEHAGLPDEASRERHSEGWQACLRILGARMFEGADRVS